MFVRLLTFAALCTTSIVNAQVQPRDLDGDPLTVEAYYDPIGNITALAHPNLALLESFGVDAAGRSDCLEGVFCGETLPGIDRFGYMEWPTADSYITAMNAANYLGQSIWRLPSANFVYDISVDRWLGGNYELEQIYNQRFDMHLPTFPGHDYRYVTDHFHPVEGRAYMRWGSVYGTDTVVGSGLTRFVVWPILDGDVGGDVDDRVKVVCSDTDGDGFGWDGVGSCIATNYSFFADTVQPLEPRDLDGDMTTVDAYYHPQLDITWLADSRLAASFDLGLAEFMNQDGSFNSTFRAEQWLATLNSVQYLGYADWRAPSTVPTYELSFFNKLYDAELDVLMEMLPQLTEADGSEFQLLAGKYFVEGVVPLTYTLREANGNFFGNTDVPGFSDSHFAWPVHDGDIGTPLQSMDGNEGISPVNAATTNLECVDSDGDGWGWDGVQSCRVTGPDGSPVPVLTECIDTDGDGWGWDGEQSCLISARS